MRKLILCAITLLINCACQSQPTDRIEIVIPSAQQETDYIWQTLQDMSFFRSQGYNVSLPQGELIEGLVQKSLEEDSLHEQDYASLEEYMKKVVYKRSDYQKGREKVVQIKERINAMIDQVLQTPRNWDFKTFAKYQVLLTLYGPGGSYDPDEGTVLLFTTSDGQFKQYNDPANTLIHEITHIGMEASIMIPLDIPHGLKERIVDTFVFLNFQDRLPEYRIQVMGDERFDEYVQTKEQLMDLRAIVESFHVGK